MTFLSLDAPTLALYTWIAIGFWIYERITRILQLFMTRLFRFRAPLVQARAVLIEGAIVLRVPFKGTWKPGQHAYLSFWDSAFIRTPHMFCQQHPFSIANVPGASEVDATGKIHEMMFVLKTRDGMTSILERKLQTSNTGMMPLWVAVEGPYGGSVDTEQFDEILLVAGGSGITHCTSGQSCVPLSLTRFQVVTCGLCSPRRCDPQSENSSISHPRARRQACLDCPIRRFVLGILSPIFPFLM